MTANTLLAHYARWIEFLGGSVSDVGWVMGSGAVLALAVRPWMGLWINRLGATSVWRFGLTIYLFSVLANLLITDVGPLIYLCRATFVLGTGLVFTSNLTYVAQIAPPHRQAEAIGVFGSAGFIAMFTGPFVGDLLLGSGERSRERFVWFFVVAAVCVAVAWLLLTLGRMPRRRSPASSVGIRNFIATVKEHWPGSILLVNLVFGMCVIIPFGFVASFVDHARIDASIQPVGLFFLGYGGWGLFVRLLSRRLADRVGRRRVLAAGTCFYALGLLCFLPVDASRPWLLLLPGMVCGTGHALTFPCVNALALEPFPQDVRGIGSSLSLMFFDLGAIAGAPILGTVAERFGYSPMFASAAIVTGVVVAYYTLCAPVRSTSLEAVASAASQERHAGTVEVLRAGPEHQPYEIHDQQRRRPVA